MAWTDPKTWAADDLVGAAELNTYLRDNSNVLAIAINTATGKIPAISSSYFESLDGANITGVAHTAANNTYSASTKQDFSGGRLLVPTGTDKWAT